MNWRTCIEVIFEITSSGRLQLSHLGKLESQIQALVYQRLAVGRVAEGQSERDAVAMAIAHGEIRVSEVNAILNELLRDSDADPAAVRAYWSELIRDDEAAA